MLLRHAPCIFSLRRASEREPTLPSARMLLSPLCCVGETNVETSVERKSDSRHELARSVSRMDRTWRDRETWSASKHASGTAWAVVPMTWMFPSEWNHYRSNESGEWPFSIRLTREKCGIIIHRCLEIFYLILLEMETSCFEGKGKFLREMLDI